MSGPAVGLNSDSAKDLSELDEFINLRDRYTQLGRRARGEAFRELFAFRELCWWLTKREIVSRYRQSLIGIGWAVLTPLATVAVFVFLKQSEALNVGATEIPYALYVYAGLVPWQLFHACLSRGTHSLVSGKSLVTRVRFPREVLVITSVGSALFDYLVGMLILLAMLVAYQFDPSCQATPTWTLLFLPLLIMGQLALGLGLGLGLSVLHVAVRDMGRVVPLFAMLWMFLTPVFLVPAQEGSWGAALNWINPMSAYVVSARDLLIGAPLSMPGELGCAVALSVVCLAFGWRLFQVMMPRVAELV